MFNSPLQVDKQWGDCIIKIGSIEQDVDFPISFKSYGFCSVGILQESSDIVIIKYMDKHTTAAHIRFRLSQVSSGVDTWIKFLSIGKQLFAYNKIKNPITVIGPFWS